MIRILFIIAAAALSLVSCSTEPTMQKYFVEKGEAKNFVAADVSPKFIKTDKMKLSADEKNALNSIQNVNILVFKANKNNTAQFEKEKTTVKGLLKTDSYEELMKINTATMGLSIDTKGKGNQIDEFIVYANQQDSGFGLIRVTGEDMTPNNVMTIAGLLQKSSLNMEQLKPLKQLFTKH